MIEKYIYISNRSSITLSRHSWPVTRINIRSSTTCPATGDIIGVPFQFEMTDETAIYLLWELSFVHGTGKK